MLVPWPGIELTSPALQGGFISTGPPGSLNQSGVNLLLFWFISGCKIFCVLFCFAWPVV